MRTFGSRLFGRVPQILQLLKRLLCSLDTYYETPKTGRRDRVVVDRGGRLTCRRSLCFLLLSWMRLASSVASSWVVIFGYPGHVSAHR